MELKIYEYEKKHLNMLRDYLPECTVLLASNGDFPLEAPCKVALFGNGARRTIKGGTGSGEVNSRFFLTVEQAMELAGFTVTTKDWLDSYDNVYKEAHEAFIKGIKARARKKHTLAVMEGMGEIMAEPEHHLPLEGEGDVCVYVLSRISGEGHDRQPVPGDILLNETEIRDILRCREQYAKFMLILNVGGPVDLSPVAEVENILLLSQLGVETGTTAVDILLGKANPSGKLATTWADWKDYPTVGEFGDPDETRYREGIYVGYRYFDSTGVMPRYPFGYGLSYTEFEIHDEGVFLEGETVCVECDVKNVGSFPGKEVLQLYVSVPAGKLDQPYQTLAAWGKSEELKPGQMQMMELRFAMSEIASYDEDAEAYILEQGSYILRLGNSSVNTQVCGMIRVAETVKVRQAKNVLGKPDFTDWKPMFDSLTTEDAANDDSAIVCEAISAELKEILCPELDPAAVSCSQILYDQPDDMDPMIGSLTDEELLFLNIGNFDPSAGPGAVIGQAGKQVAGAAGETTSQLGDHDVPVMVMADGPAGLRLTQHFFVDKNGVHGLQGGMVESFYELMPKPALWMMRLTEKKPKRGQKIHDQYCTAIPIGTAIAQSWNLAFAEMCGDIVGAEMERFGVHLWLAPALNIHRSIQCGRNFEYYSEDPVISGRMAAAITLGVQVHPGCGVTIKHYAGNNQETNRYYSNSQVSERAMREIYLKGFGICVRESQPKAVMTSYNLLNGTHTSEHRGLIQDILRSEFGFLGMVMTDWVVSGMTNKEAIYDAPVPHKVAMAGNDVFMPGSPAEFKEMKQALTEKTLSSEQLAINATRVYRLAKELTGARR